MITFLLIHISESEFPSYIYDAIEQIRLFHDVNDIYLFINRKSKRVNYSKLDFYKCKVEYIDDLKKSEKHEKYIRKKKGDSFWVRTQERFFVLEEAIQKIGLKDVIHIENDNLIYNELEDVYKNAVEKMGDFLVPHLGTKYSCGSVCFIKGIEGLARYNEYLVEQDKNIEANDMETLTRFFSENNLVYLPTVYDGFFSDKEQASKHTTGADSLQGFFDAAVIGQYLGGAEKRSYSEIMRGVGFESSIPGIKKYINTNTGLKAELIDIHWVKDERSRFIPVCYNNEKIYRIYNLHIHSKELFRFKSNNKYIAEGLLDS